MPSPLLDTYIKCKLNILCEMWNPRAKNALFADGTATGLYLS